MLKKQQKWIALLMTLTFAWLLQVSTMPLAAASTTEQASSASVDQAPGFIEQQGPEWNRPVKKNIVFIIVIAVVVYALITALIHTGSALMPRPAKG